MIETMANTFDRVSIIYNPNSSGTAKQNSEQLRATLHDNLDDVTIDLLETEYAGHATELAYRTAKTYAGSLIVSASGDGGYNEVINGVIRAQAEGFMAICAVEPSGNANDHARSVHDRSLSELIIAREVKPIDILEVGMKHKSGETKTRFVHSYVGLGLTPAVAAQLDKNRFGSIGEAIMLMWTFWKLRPVTMRASDDVRTSGNIAKYDCVVWSIVPNMAKVFTLSKDAAPDDGKFEMTVLPHHQKIKLFYHILRGVFANMQADSRSAAYACTVLHDSPIQFDGEVERLRADTELTVSIRPGLLRTIA